MIAWFVAAALAGDPGECGTLAPPPERLSVAWVSPAGRGAGRASSLLVVPTTALRTWVAADAPSVGRMLQHLGLRKRDTAPKRRYKVTIFDVRAVDLCRPLDEQGEEDVAAGLPACAERFGEPRRGSSGCGYARDGGSKKRSFDVYRVRWEDAAAAGFCVLPAEAFVAEAPRRVGSPGR